MTQYIKEIEIAGTVYPIKASGGGGGGVGIPTSICKMLRLTKGASTITLNWKDPSNTIIDGQTLCTWEKTVVVRKKGSYPADESDGTVIVTNTVRDMYDLSGYVDTLPDSDEYFYRAFPISVNGAVSYDPANKFGNKVYEFVINPSDSNPSSRVTYQGDCLDYTPAHMNFTTGVFDYGSWESAFFMGLFKPCMVYNDEAGDALKGTVMEYLDPNNYGLTTDGGVSHVADDTCKANAMVEIGQIWIKETLDGDGKQHIFIASEQMDSNYDCYTHIKKDGTYRDKIYRSIYDGCNISNKIRSISGKTPCHTTPGNTQIAYANANGTGWSIDEYNVRRLINYLLILIGKSTDTQSVFGNGRYTGGSSASALLQSGTLNTKGMFWGDTANNAMKVFHIENWWGNIWKWTYGCLQSGGKLYYKMCEGTHDGTTVENYSQSSVTGYLDSGVTNSGTVSSVYIKEMSLVPHIGLVPKSTSGGSSSTYFADGMWSNSSVLGFARFGGVSIDGLLVGGFAFSVDGAVSHSYWDNGVSLSYKSS